MLVTIKLSFSRQVLAMSVNFLPLYPSGLSLIIENLQYFILSSRASATQISVITASHSFSAQAEDNLHFENHLCKLARVLGKEDRKGQMLAYIY